MYLELVLFLAGLALLLYGAQTVVTHASGLALYYGVSAFFIGITVISIGTSIPEMTTSVFSALYGAGDLVVGNIVGSETAQITLAVGIVALLAPIAATRDNVAVYGGGMLVAMAFMILVLEDGSVIRSEGALMIFSYVFFLYHMYTREDHDSEVLESMEEKEKPAPPKHAVPWLFAGIVMVIVGGHFMVSNGIALAQLFGVPQYLIGLLTGLGTTIPEVAVAGLAAVRGSHGLSGGSLFGSNITDPLLSLGLGGLVADVAVSNTGSVLFSATYMLLVSGIVVALFYWREGIDRKTAVICLFLYVPTFFTDEIFALLTATP